MSSDIEQVLRDVLPEIDRKFASYNNGLAGLFGESLLTIALAESLHKRNWSIEVEKDFRSVMGEEAPAGYLNYDLLATTASGERCLFELKYLKPPKGWGPGRGLKWTAVGDSRRLIDDILRLAYPRATGLRRFFVVGRECELKYPADFPTIRENARQLSEYSVRRGVALEGDGAFLEPSDGLMSSMKKIEERLPDYVGPFSCTIRLLNDPLDERCSTVAVDIFEVCPKGDPVVHYSNS